MRCLCSRAIGVGARNGWIALKGDDEPFFLHTNKREGYPNETVRRSTAAPTKGDPEMGSARQGARYAWLIRWSNPAIKDRLKRILDGRGGKWTLPEKIEDEDLEKEYQAQMRAEYPIMKVRPSDGRRIRTWVCPSGNNHLFDCSCMQVVGATLLGILPDELSPLKEEN